MPLRTRLTARYVVALALLACTLFATHAVLHDHSKARAADGWIINLSGMQRMLSQRIALLARELAHAGDARRADRVAAQLDAAVRRMRSNHATLSAQRLDGGAARAAMTDPSALYFHRSRLDERVRRLLATSRTLLDRYERGGLEAVRDGGLSRRIVSLSLDGLLEDLDAVVQRYEAAFEQGQRDGLHLETSMLGLVLLVMVAEALVIFRPMVRTVVDSVGALERSNAELGEFVYRLSHDLRAPIASARGLIEVLDDSLQEEDVADARQIRLLVDGSLRRLDALIDDLTEVVRARGLDVPAEPVDLQALVDDVLAELAHAPGFETLSIEVDVEPGRPVHVKRRHLRSALANLVSNAIKYADPAEPCPRLRIGVSRSDRIVRIETSDNGLGIPEPYRVELFEMFKRFHPRVSTGSGLGLYLVRLSMEAIGGTSRYEPLPDGSRFELSFAEREGGTA